MYSWIFDEYFKNFGLVFDCLNVVNLKLKVKKCNFFRKEVIFLGYVIFERGVKIDLSKIVVVENWKMLINISEFRSFLGFVFYYWWFIKDFVKVVKCLYELISKNKKWMWMLECDEVFMLLKFKFVSVFIFGYLDVNGGIFILDMDVSSDIIGVVLF